MARTLSCRAWRPGDAAAVAALARSLYAHPPSPGLLPPDCCVVEDGSDIVGFGALYHLPGVSIATTDWIMTSLDLARADRVAVLGLLIAFFREIQEREGLDAVMIYSPFAEIRDHLAAPDLQEGERGVQRLSVRFTAE